MYNIQKNFGKYGKLPVCNTIKKILIGKLVSFQCRSKRSMPMVILAVRRNNLYGHLQILLGEYNRYSVSVMSWYNYMSSKDIIFVGRDTKEAIRKCLKTSPKYIQYHLGESVDLSNVQVIPELYTKLLHGKLPIYDNHNYYNDYLSLL